MALYANHLKTSTDPDASGWQTVPNDAFMYNEGTVLSTSFCGIRCRVVELFRANLTTDASIKISLWNND